MPMNYGTLFESWEIAVAKKLVNDFIKDRRCFEEYDFDDLLQECLTHWLRVRDRYDAGRKASKQTFMGRIIRNKLKDLVEQRQADKRKIDHVAKRLDAPLGDEQDSRTLLNKVDEETTEDSPRDRFSEIERGVYLERALEKLSPGRQELCRLLAEGRTVSDISELLKTPRSTIYDEMKRIREVFSKEGLRGYLD